MLISEFNFLRGVANTVRNKMPRIKLITPKYAKKLSVGRKAIATSKTRAANINKNIAPNSMADGMTSVTQRSKYKATKPSLRGTAQQRTPITSSKSITTKATPKGQRTTLQQYKDRQKNKYS